MNNEVAMKLRTGLGEHMQRVGTEQQAKEANLERVRTWLTNAFRNGVEQDFRKAMPSHAFLVTRNQWDDEGYALAFSFSYLPDQPDPHTFPENVVRDVRFDIEWHAESHMAVCVVHSGNDRTYLPTVDIVDMNFPELVTDLILKALEIEREARRAPWPHELGR